MQLKLHKHLTNEEIADVLNFISQILKAKGADRFRAAAYENAAAAIKIYPKQLHQMFLTDPDFDEIPGIGESLNKKITELFTTGNIKALQKYAADVPEGTYPLVQVHGIGGKRALFLANHFKLNNADTALSELLAHAQQGHIHDLPGYGEKSEAEIVDQLQRHQGTDKSRMPYAQAHRIANELIAYLKKSKDVEKIEALGSIRRQAPTIGDIDLGMVVKNMKQVTDYVKKNGRVKNVIVSGEQLMRVFLKDGIQVDLKVVPTSEWGSFLQHFTGSKEHNIKLREYALEKNLSLSEHGIKVLDPQTHHELEMRTFADEKDFYYALELKWIPPQDRLGKKEIGVNRLK